MNTIELTTYKGLLSGMYKAILGNNPIFNQGDDYELRPLTPEE